MPPTGVTALGAAIELTSCILENSGMLDPSDLVELSRRGSDHWLSACFLETVASVENPFLTGITLSVGLAKAAEIAPRGEGRKLSSLQNKVDNLLLEILERLPQTVQGFEVGMASCAALFEPEVDVEDARGFQGPLWMVLQSREHMETYCSQPLIVNFLVRRYACGLPNLVGTKELPNQRQELIELAHGAASACDSRTGMDKRSRERCLVLDVQDKLSGAGTRILNEGLILRSILSPCIMLQGLDPDRQSLRKSSLSVLPGAQFLTAGVAAKPDAYYRVPDVRMVLDVAVYLGMLVVFSAAILFHDDGPLTAGEVMFAFYVLVCVTRRNGWSQNYESSAFASVGDFV